MSRFMILGEYEFILGFKLAGINDLIETNESICEKEIKKIIEQKTEGILVINEETLNHISERTKKLIQDSVKPVIVVLQESSEQETIRRMIIKAIGIDIMAKNK